MSKLKIEFYHDVICSFCFPMSLRMRELSRELDNIEIVHRSFALAPDSHSLAMQFGTHELAKNEIVSHWEAANKNDGLNRFNIEGMKKSDILFPTSMNPLTAVKAGLSQQKDWDIFDKLQEGLFVRNLKIDEDEIIYELIKELDLDFDTWLKEYKDPETRNKVQEELVKGQLSGINSVPSLVVNEKYLINGAQPKEIIIRLLEQIQEKEKEQLIDLSLPDGQSCDLDGNCN